MVERWPPDAIEPALVDLGRRLAFPPTPDLATRARSRIEARRPRPRTLGALLPPWPRLAAAVAAALVLVAALLGLSSSAREAVADLLGLTGVRFFAVPEGSAPAPPPAPTTAASAGLALGGMPVPLDEARRRAGFPLRLPSLPGIGAPDEVYLSTTVPGGVLTLVYHPRPGLPPARDTGIGLLITQFRGEYEPFLQKGLPAGASVQPVVIGGARGFWIEGTPHVLVFRDTAGVVREERSRLAGNTLLWEREGVTFRLESALDRDAAIRVAESLR
jgi:hypothetical protein